MVIDGQQTEVAEVPDSGQEVKSPLGKYRVEFSDHNVQVIENATGARWLQSEDGTEERSYASGRIHWSPDGERFVVFRRTMTGGRKIHLVESSPRDQIQPRLMTIDYVKPGDDIDQYAPVLIDCQRNQ